jgi:hypothetical protein
MWLETTMPLDPGERVVLCFRLPKSERELMLFARVGRVVRDERDMLTGASGVGLEFVGVTMLEHAQLEDALRGLPPVLPGHKRDRRAIG